MKTFEYICTTFTIAGILFVLTSWEADRYGPLLAPVDTQMHCPDLRFMHYVGGNLKTGLDVVDACASNLNVVKY